MLVVAGDPDMASPLAEAIDADLCLGSRMGLACTLPAAIRSMRSLRRWRSVVLVVGIKEVLDRRSSVQEDREIYLETFGTEPPGETFRAYDRNIFSFMLEEMGVLLSEPNPRPFVMVVPVAHCLPGPKTVTPCLNHLLSDWCRQEDFLMLPEGTFPYSKRERLYDDPVRGSVSGFWIESVVTAVTRHLDRVGE